MTRWAARGVLLACLASLASLTGHAARAEPVKILVALGNNVGLADEARLRWADDDARRMRDVFVTLGGVRAEHALLVRSASRAEALTALRDAAAIARRHAPEDVTLVVYFSGHGDDTQLHLGGERLGLDELAALVAAAPAHLRLTVLDACRTGVGRDKGLVPDAPFAIALDTQARMSGQVRVRASAPGEASQESDELSGAVFTHYFVSALRGAADADADQQVTFDEAYAFAYRHTHRRTSAAGVMTQRPSLDVALTGSGLFVLTRTSTASATLLLPRGADIAYLIYALPAGTVIGEAWGNADGPTRVALPSGRFEVQRRAPGRHGAALAQLPYGGVMALSDDDFAAYDEQTLRDKGGHLLEPQHALALSYAPSFDADAMGHAARLGFEQRSGRAWLVLFGLELGVRDYATEVLAVGDVWLGASVGAAVRLPLGALELRPTLTLGAERLWRTTTRHDDVSGLGLSASEHTAALALAAEAGLSADVPIVAGLHARLAAAAHLRAFRDRGGVVTDFAARLELGLAWWF